LERRDLVHARGKLAPGIHRKSRCRGWKSCYGNRIALFGMPIMSPRLLLLLAIVPALPAYAGIYKCAGEKAGVVYQDAPCAPGKELRNLETDPATLSVVPGTPVPRHVVVSASAPKPVHVHEARTRNRGGNAAERRFLRTGMTEAEVLHKLGRPDMQLNSRRKEGKQWSYLPAADDVDTLTTVTFVGGKVSNVERKVVR
jgi:hypothetical protein